MHFVPIDRIFLALPISAAAAWAAWRLKSLSLSGRWAAALLGTFVLGFGGWDWALPLLAFFVSSSLLSRLRTRTKGDTEEAKGSVRDAAQVLANGGLAGILALLHGIGDRDLYIAYLGSLSAATADTWSTEIGLMWGRAPRLVTDWKPVTPGTSGGVTVIGFLGALLAAVMISASGIVSNSHGIGSTAGVLVIVAGLSGSLVDSLLGATLQARRRCQRCGKMTEKLHHCGTISLHSGGWKWLNNDWVNGLSTAFGALLCLALT